MSVLPNYVHTLLHNIAKCEGFAEGFAIKLQPGCSQGDGFLGIIISVTISGQRHGDQSTTGDELHLVCKMAPENAARREGFDSIVLCKREALMYEKILPELAAFEREKGLTDSDRFIAYPKCYAAVADEEKDHFVLIMEDVRHKGYSMWKRSDPLPVKYTRGLLEQLAKMHAVSFALKQQRPQVYDAFRAISDVVSNFIETNTMREIIRASYARCLAAVEDPKHIAIVKDISENDIKYYLDCVSDECVEPFGAITHGDCWINNILFRYNEGAPVDICLVDWQMSRFGSIIMDLHYIMFTSIHIDVLRTEYESIMKHYYDSLQRAVQRLGSELHAYTYEVFRDQLKKFSKLAFIMGLVMAQIFVVDSDDLKDLDEISENPDADYVQKIDGESELKYKDKIRNLLDILIELGYYWK